MDIQFAPNVEVNIMPESAPIRQGGMSRTAAVVTLTAPDGRQARCWLAATIDECGRPVFYATALGRSDKSDRKARLVGAWHDFEARTAARLAELAAN